MAVNMPKVRLMQNIAEEVQRLYTPDFFRCRQKSFDETLRHIRSGFRVAVFTIVWAGAGGIYSAPRRS